MIAVKGVTNVFLKGGIYRVLVDNWELVVRTSMYVHRIAEQVKRWYKQENDVTRVESGSHLLTHLTH